jgi:hypothetical protein
MVAQGLGPSPFSRKTDLPREPKINASRPLSRAQVAYGRADT